jgi:hypothetical protein
VNTLVQQLLELTGRLQLAGATTAQQLAELRRKIAAVLIVQDPSLMPVPDNPSADPLLQQAAKAGEILAKDWIARGILRPRFVQDPYLADERNPEQPTEVLGPFVDGDLALVQYAFYEATKFFNVRLGESVIALLPLKTVVDSADPAKWKVPAGTVWLRASRIVAGTSGWAGLRVTAGTLQAAGAQKVTDGVQLGNSWTLNLTPEPAPASTTATGDSDGDAAAVTLPTQFQVTSTLSTAVTGPLALTGLGTPLSVTPAPGAPFRSADDNAILFPFTVGATTWSITTRNRSQLFELKLTPAVKVSSAGWALPLTLLPVDQLGDARHGGALVFQIPQGLRSQVSGTVRGALWRDTRITVNARGIEIRAAKAQSEITMDLGLWGGSRTTAQISHPTADIAVRHASRRNGSDIVAFTVPAPISATARGRVVHHWDRPRTASGTPFEFDGSDDIRISLIAERSTGLRRVTLLAARTPDPTVCGYALENLYLHTRPARRTTLVGSGTATRLTEGQARLLFDVLMAQPALPNAYVANWDVDQNDFRTTESALSAVVSWPNVTSPTLKTTLLSEVRIPDTPTVDDPNRNYLYLLDVSGRDDQLGVVMVKPTDEPLAVEQNRLVWPMRYMGLTMLPQVLWEPVTIMT